jgi:hypothetical protein
MSLRLIDLLRESPAPAGLFLNPDSPLPTAPALRRALVQPYTSCPSVAARWVAIPAADAMVIVLIALLPVDGPVGVGKSTVLNRADVRSLAPT